MATWGKVLNAGQKTVATLLLGLTLYGGYVMADGGYGVVQRRKRQKGDDAVVKKEDVSSSSVLVFAMMCCMICCYLHSPDCS